MAEDLLKIKLQTSIPNFKELGRKVQRDFRARLKVLQKEAALDGAKILLNEIVKTDSFATGKLYRSVSTRFIASKSTDGYRSQIGFVKPGSEYAYYANYGREAGNPPPVRAIKSWARARGIPVRKAYGIAQAIGRYGTEPKLFFENAVPRIERAFDRKVREFLRNLRF